LTATTDYAYDVSKLQPRPKCSTEHDCRLVRVNAVDAILACRSSNLKGTGISATVIYADALSSRTAQWLARILDVGGTLVHIYPSVMEAEGETRLRRDRLTFDEWLVPARHYIQMLPTADGAGLERWMIACSRVDLYCLHKPDELSVRSTDGPGPFIDWLKGIPVQDTICEVSNYLCQPKELDSLLCDADESKICARLPRMPVPPSFKYPGRWLRGTPPCLSLTRIEIDGEESVRCCRHGEPIGKVGDTKEALAARIGELAAKARQRRGCDQCPHSHCPRCPFPGVDEKAYCTLMGEQPGLLRLLNCVYLYSCIPSILVVQKDKGGGD
jgi:hypothetical protein